MSPAARRWLYWSPRVLILLFALFLAVFALDVFDENLGFPRVLVALGMHLIPTALVLVVLAIAWRHEWLGAGLLLGLGAGYLARATSVAWAGRLVIAGPLFAAGLLFLVGWIRRSELRARA